MLREGLKMEIPRALKLVSEPGPVPGSIHPSVIQDITWRRFFPDGSTLGYIEAGRETRYFRMYRNEQEKVPVEITRDLFFSFDGKGGKYVFEQAGPASRV